MPRVILSSALLLRGRKNQKRSIRKSGNKVTGYLFNRTATGEQPTIELFPATSNGTMTIPYSEVATIAFTGEDTATGKSWETWVTKKDSERQREVERVEADAKSRGHL